jgi:DNA-binding NarL/FixJ family response regulator
MSAAPVQIQSLSEIQRRVAALARQGFSNKEIARRLDVSEGSVKQHLFNVYRKLKIRSRAALYHHLAEDLISLE